MRCREFRVGGLFSRRWALALLLRADTAEEAAREIGSAEQALRTWCGTRDRFGDKVIFSLVAPLSLLPRMRDALEIALNFGSVAKIVGDLRVEVECFDEWGERRDGESRGEVPAPSGPQRDSTSSREFRPGTAGALGRSALHRQERTTSIHERRRRALLRQAGAHTTPPN